jgi:hypothetical protein
MIMPIDKPEKPEKKLSSPEGLQPIKPFKYPYPFTNVYCFKITLKEVTPVVWRRIEVPETYSFWDLHVALTDVFGWWDSHLHEFNIKNLKTGRKERLGIWDEDDPGVKMDWRFRISAYFRKRKNPKAIHKYDFGDGWEHLIELEDVHYREDNVIYPRCLEGARACPPDDCGGPWGYQELLKIIKDPSHKEYEDKIDWLGYMKNMEGADFDPEHFDPAEVRFDDPDKRWAVAFDEDPMTPDMRMWEWLKGQQGKEDQQGKHGK